MFRGFKYQVVLPVAAITLLLISLGAVGFSVWAMQQVQSRVRQRIADNVTSIQGVFGTTASLMQDRVRASMALLQDQIKVRGNAEKGPQVSVAGKTVNDVLIGGKGQAGDFELVDYVTRMNKGTATIFTKDGDRFVRIATNVMKDDGTRAVGTELNNTTPAYAAIRSRVAFYGIVDILDHPYFTGYEPLLSKNGEAIGIAYVGYKTELPILKQALDQAHLLKSGFIAVVDNNKARYLPSGVTAEQVQQATDNKDGSWAIDRLPLAGLGLDHRLRLSHCRIARRRQAGRLRSGAGRNRPRHRHFPGTVLPAGQQGTASARRRTPHGGRLHEENRRRRSGARDRDCGRTARQPDGLAESDAAQAQESYRGRARRRG